VFYNAPSLSTQRSTKELASVFKSKRTKAVDVHIRSMSGDRRRHSMRLFQVIIGAYAETYDSYRDAYPLVESYCQLRRDMTRDDTPPASLMRTWQRFQTLYAAARGDAHEAVRAQTLAELDNSIDTLQQRQAAYAAQRRQDLARRRANDDDDDGERDDADDESDGGGGGGDGDDDDNENDDDDSVDKSGNDADDDGGDDGGARRKRRSQGGGQNARKRTRVEPVPRLKSMIPKSMVSARTRSTRSHHRHSRLVGALRDLDASIQWSLERAVNAKWRAWPSRHQLCIAGAPARALLVQ